MMMKKYNKNEALEFAKYYYSWICECNLKNSTNTIRSYESAMNLYINYLETNKGLKPGLFSSKNDFSSTTIKEWLGWLKERGCSPQSCNVRLASIRAFLEYIAEQNTVYRYLYLDAQSIHRMKEQQKKVNGISKIALKELMLAPDALTTTGFRDIVLMAFLYGTAARIDEVLSVKVADVYLYAPTPYVTVVGKGNKIRTLYLPPKLVDHLIKYIKKFHKSDFPKDNYLFYSRVKGVLGKISQEAINKRLKIYAAKAHQKCAEVPIHLHAHQFRHAKSTHLLEDGINIVQLSKILGHENISTTMKYLDITLDMKSKAIISLEDESVAKIPQKWNSQNDTLSGLFKV